MKYLINGYLLFLCILTIFAGLFYFYNLSWGEPFFFHPDERNIASAISGLSFPNQMNPHFFAYGSLPIYLIYITGLFTNILTSIGKPIETYVSFESAIIISRYFSAFLAIALIPSAFYIGKFIWNNKVGLIAAILMATSTGILQFSHFGTFELWTTFFSLWLFFFCIKVLISGQKKYLLITAFILGLLVLIKVSNIIFLPIPIACFSFFLFKNRKKIGYKRLALRVFSFFVFIFALLVLLVAIISPFVFLDFSAFQNSMEYESSVARGTLPVFYTQQFSGTQPIEFQLVSIFPFLLNPLITLLFIFSLIFLIILSMFRKRQQDILLLAFFFLIFFSQAFFYVKWTRYMVPTLPFIYLIISVGIYYIYSYFSKNKSSVKTIYPAIFTLFLISFIFFFSYFYSVINTKDTRVSASLWAERNIQKDAKILSESFDLGIIPFNKNYLSIKLHNIYDLETTKNTKELAEKLSSTDYIILPSQRLYKTRMMQKQQFPIGNNYYMSLFSGKLGYKKVYETTCDIFCLMVYKNQSLFPLEETTSVFTNPTVSIFKKIKNYSLIEYEKILYEK